MSIQTIAAAAKNGKEKNVGWLTTLGSLSSYATGVIDAEVAILVVIVGALLVLHGEVKVSTNIGFEDGELQVDTELERENEGEAGAIESEQIDPELVETLEQEYGKPLVDVLLRELENERGIETPERRSERDQSGGNESYAPQTDQNESDSQTGQTSRASSSPAYPDDDSDDDSDNGLKGPA